MNTPDEYQDILWECVPEEEKQRILQSIVTAVVSSQFYGTPITTGTCCEDRKPVKATPIPGIKPY